MHIARHFWNTCRLSIKRKLERSLLLDPLNELIHHINTVSPKSIISNRNDKETVRRKKNEFGFFVSFLILIFRKKKNQIQVNHLNQKNNH